MKRIVLALGGNALQVGNTISPQNQLDACFHTAKSVVALIEKGYDIAIVHGNGPQVGEVVLTSEIAHKVDPKHPVLPFDVCSAFTQGYIGYQLQNAIKYELQQRNLERDVVALVTQVEVAKTDPAFQNPTKPVGSFYSQADAERLRTESGYVMKEDAGRGYRRVIASPKPLNIVELNSIKSLFERHTALICCGGGGIPVVRENDGHLKGVEAVIDKDSAAAKLAELIDADMLIILTAVEKVAINFNKPNQENLSVLTVADAKKHIQDGQFAPGSMLPKIEASLSFLSHNPNSQVLITSLEKAALALEGKTGTIVKA